MLENNDEVNLYETCTETLNAHLQCDMWINVQTYAAQLSLHPLQLLPENSVCYPSASMASFMTNITLLASISACNRKNRKSSESPWNKNKNKKKKWRTESRLCFGFPVYGAKAGSRSYIDNMDPSVTLMVKCLITLLQHRPSSVLVQDKGLVSFCMNYTLSQKWNCHTWGKARH